MNVTKKIKIKNKEEEEEDLKKGGVAVRGRTRRGEMEGRKQRGKGMAEKN